MTAAAATPERTLHCGTSAGELVVQAGLGFEHTPPYIAAVTVGRGFTLFLEKNPQIFG